MELLEKTREELLELAKKLNLKVPTDFRAKVNLLMNLCGHKSQSEAIRKAVDEALERARNQSRSQTAFSSLLGTAKEPSSGRKPRFQSNEELWEADTRDPRFIRRP